MNRRRFLRNAAFVAALPCGEVLLDGTVRAAAPARRTRPFRADAEAVTGGPAAGARYDNVLVLIEQKGGNDGLNTVVPFADPGYYALRPKLAIARDAVVQLTEHAALHPALAPLLPLWKEGGLAVLQGIGYPRPNLSHFRSIEIWDTASDSEHYVQDGWLARTFASVPTPATFAADGVVIGSNDLGPLAGAGTRAIALADTDQFVRQARLATPAGQAYNAAYRHILKVESDIVQAASHLAAAHAFATPFPATPFGKAVRTACQVIANPAGVAVVRITLNGFDTHSGQPATQARLLADLAQGLLTLRQALAEIDAWERTLVLTYAEFGRRPKENLSQGTDHGTANVHFAAGGKVQGGMYGAAPALDRLDGNGNLAHAIDFRSVYASVLERWWGVPSRDVLGGRFATVPFLPA